MSTIKLIDGNIPSINQRKGENYSLGLLSLEAYILKETNWDVEIIYPVPIENDATYVDSIRNILKSIHADILGISVTSLSLPPILLALQDDTFKNQFIVLGGPGVNSLPTDFLYHFSCIDVLIHGEGEQAIVDVIHWYEKKQNYIRNSTYRNMDSVIHKSSYERLASLDEIPALNYPLLKDNSSPPKLMIESSRGCPYGCTFCGASHLWGKQIVTKSVGNIMKTLLPQCQSSNNLGVVFVDDLFTISKTRVMNICQEFINNDLNVLWACFGRIDSINEDMLKIMAESGCKAISFGVESGNDEILKAVQKDITVEKIKNVLIKAVKIIRIVEVSFIVGFPFETYSSFTKTLELMNFCHSIGCRIKVYYLTPLPGTSLYKSYHSDWVFDPKYNNPSLKPLYYTREIQNLFSSHPYLAIPYGYFSHADLRKKETAVDMWLQKSHELVI